MKRSYIKNPAGDLGGKNQIEELKKGQLIAVKAPPYYRQEYTYEVTASGDKLIRANLSGSSKVRKSWSREEFSLLVEMNMIRFINESSDESTD